MRETRLYFPVQIYDLYMITSFKFWDNLRGTTICSPISSSIQFVYAFVALSRGVEMRKKVTLKFMHAFV